MSPYMIGFLIGCVLFHVVLFAWDREAYLAALGRILTLGGRLKAPARKVECGIEPTWVPMPGGYARNDESLPPFASLVTPMSAWNPPRAALIPVWSDCEDCETVETQRLCDPVPTKRLSRPCSRHQEAQ